MTDQKDNIAEISRADLRWFCHLSVERRILTAEESRNLVAVLGEEAHLLEYAEELFERGYHYDLNLIQDLVNESSDLARAGVPPPRGLPSVLPEEAFADATEIACLPALPEDMFPRPEDAEQWLLAALAAARQHTVSDVHLSAGAPPCWRRAGVLETVSHQTLSADAALLLNTALLDKTQRRTLQANHDFSAAVELPNGERYRVNVVNHHGGTSGTYHVIPGEVRSLAELGFAGAASIERLLDAHNGLMLITGPAGSGKTTTLAALIDVLNRKRYCHVITVEDPIEIVHPPGTCFITQRQVAVHTRNYATALRAALREDPDVIVIGEMRDLETIEMGVTAAETGHLVLGTLHTSDAASTLNRILAVFPPMQQSQIRSMLAESLRGIICQRLLPRADGEGQVLASEVLINTPAAANLIRDGRAHHLEGVMQTGINRGMQTMDRDVLRLCHQEMIDEETALRNIRSREIIARLRKMRELMNTVQVENEPQEPAEDSAADTKSRRYIDSEDLG